MDLKAYYQKIRAIASTIEEEFVVVVSRETPDGGKEGVLTEVAAKLAARLVVEGLARLATAVESEAFRSKQADAKRAADAESAASKVRLTVLPSEELDRLKGLIEREK